MKAIIVDDEPIMLSSFLRLSKGIPDLEIIGKFQNGEDVLRFADDNRIELAFLDVKMPGMDGIQLAEKLKEKQPDIILVFISAYDEYIREFNRIGLHCFEPKGAFYVFPSIKSTGLSSEEFCEQLVYNKKIAVVPGSAFGAGGEGHVRVSYSYSLNHLKKAVAGIEAFVRERS